MTRGDEQELPCPICKSGMLRVDDHWFCDCCFRTWDDTGQAYQADPRMTLALDRICLVPDDVATLAAELAKAKP